MPLLRGFAVQSIAKQGRCSARSRANLASCKTLARIVIDSRIFHAARTDDFDHTTGVSVFTPVEDTPRA